MADLTATTLWQFSGCVACYFLGALLLGREQRVRWLLIGVLAAFAFCLVRAVDQRLFEFPQNRQMLVEGERAGWTNFPPELFVEMKREQVIITTNGVDVANPGHPRQVRQRPRQRHAGLSERAGRPDSAAVAGFAGVGVQHAPNDCGRRFAPRSSR